MSASLSFFEKYTKLGAGDGAGGFAGCSKGVMSGAAADDFIVNLCMVGVIICRREGMPGTGVGDQAQ